MNLFLSLLKSLRKQSEIVLALGVVGIVLLLLIPLPAFLLDALISLNILFSMTTLLVTLYVKEPMEFSSFPSLLLFLTLLRLGVNISSTRMILSEGQAGNIIQTFGEFVTGGSQFIGLVIFVLLTVINFIVVTKGSGRVAEVAARFTLDAMPGKQMAIDADLNAGIITEKEAKARREKVSSESDFYGSMDGASKFVKGDAIAGIIITVINVLAGFVVGVFGKDMDWETAMSTYSTLSIGDGLVSQVPALLISVGAGIIVTRSSSQEGLGSTLSTQIFSDPRVLAVSAAILAAMGLIPGMPLLIMWSISAILGLYAYQLQKSHSPTGEWIGEEGELAQSSSEREDIGELEQKDQEEKLEQALFVELMEIELGYSLLSLVDPDQGGSLLARIQVIRRQVASELGMILPSVRVRDEMNLEGNFYVIKMKGIEIASGTLHADSYLAMDAGGVTEEISGEKTVEPAFGFPALWIAPHQKEKAEQVGYTVVDSLSVLATHLTEIIHLHAHELLNRQALSELIEQAKKHAEAVVEELIPNLLSLGQVLRVLQNLLKERIPIRDLVTILETLADHSAHTKEVDILTEYVRQKLSRTISKQYSSQEQKMYAITLDARVEETLIESIQKNEFGQQMALHPQVIANMVEQLQKRMKENAQKAALPILLTSPLIRFTLHRLIERHLPRLPVLSFYEISPDIEIESVGVIPSDVLL